MRESEPEQRTCSGETPSGTVDTTENENILEMRNIAKAFPGVVANDHIDFDLRAGEIHSILGENGAGKTTLMNILYGLYRMDEGEILINGKQVSIESPRDAVSLGISMIHQFFTLVPGLPVIENVILGQEPTKGPFLDLKRAEKEVLELEGRFNLEVDLQAKPEQLTVGQKQKVEILKALYQGAKILVMDEPTSVLMPHEKEELMKTLRQMTAEGALSIIFITHKLPEAIAASDRITILRKGRKVDTVEAGKVNQKTLARKMVGREVLFRIAKSETEKGGKALEVRGLKAIDDTGKQTLKGVSLYVLEGEILGIAGVSGNGQEELVDVIMGLRPATAGEVLVKGRDTTNSSPGKIRGLGVGYIPEDRLGRGILSDMSLGENLVLGAHKKRPFAHRWLLPFENRWFTNQDQIHDHADSLIVEYGIDAPSPGKRARKLSGGNIQKLILAREFSMDFNILIADKPTSGLDVGSQEHIRRKLLEERERGKAILLISEDLDEITMMSDRIAVMYEGRIVSIVPVEETTKEEIGKMITGATRKEHPAVA